MLDGGALGVRRQREDEDAPSVLRREVEQRTQRAEPEVRRDGDGVPGERGVAHEGVGVPRHGRADVAALGVDDRQQPRRAGVGDDPLQGRDPAGAVPLEERRLRFDAGDVPGEGLDDGAAEPLHTVRVVGQAPRREQRRVRVDPRAQRTVRGDRSGEPRPEARDAHARKPSQAPTSRAVCSCSDATRNPSPWRSASRVASMACTAAESSWIVVMIGEPTDVAAARIS